MFLEDGEKNHLKWLLYLPRMYFAKSNHFCKYALKEVNDHNDVHQFLYIFESKNKNQKSLLL